MPRVKGGVVTRRKHKKVLKAAKGYRAGRSTQFRQAKRAVMSAGQDAYRDRKKKKRVFRRVWITRINAAVRALGIMYSRFIRAMDDKNIKIDRKILADIAVKEPGVFKQIVEVVKK